MPTITLSYLSNNFIAFVRSIHCTKHKDFIGIGRNIEKIFSRVFFYQLNCTHKHLNFSALYAESKNKYSIIIIKTCSNVARHL